MRELLIPIGRGKRLRFCGGGTYHISIQVMMSNREFK